MIFVLETCTEVFFDRAVKRNEKLRFFEFFERRIQYATNGEAESFFQLKQQLRKLSLSNQARDKDSTLMQLLDELLDISEEVDLMNEIKDVHEELVFLKALFNTQLNVLAEVKSAMTFRSTEREDAPKLISVIERCGRLYDNLDQRRIKIEEMDEMAWRTYKNLNNLFDLKQKQANVLEAHYSRKVAQDSSRNSIAFLIFTVVSIIFLPLTFVAQFMALPVQSWPHNSSGNLNFTLSYVSSRVFGIGIAIAVCVVAMAFSLNFFILEIPWRRLQTAVLRNETVTESTSNLEKKEVLARSSPGNDALSLISYHSYDERKSPSRSSIATWLRSWKAGSFGSDGSKEGNGAWEA